MSSYRKTQDSKARAQNTSCSSLQNSSVSGVSHSRAVVADLGVLEDRAPQLWAPTLHGPHPGVAAFSTHLTALTAIMDRKRNHHHEFLKRNLSGLEMPQVNPSTQENVCELEAGLHHVAANKIENSRVFTVSNER